MIRTQEEIQQEIAAKPDRAKTLAFFVEGGTAAPFYIRQGVGYAKTEAENYAKKVIEEAPYLDISRSKAAESLQALLWLARDPRYDIIEREVPKDRFWRMLKEFRHKVTRDDIADVTWNETTEERFHEMNGVVPPAAMDGAWFLVGEPSDHDKHGYARFDCYRQQGGVYQVASRPVNKGEYALLRTVT
jgi:hypothetical protein